MKKSWDEIWRETEKLPWFRRKSYGFIKKALESILIQTKLSKNSKIIDVGCGTGFTLSFFRELGYKNSIGIDNSPSSIKLCKKLFDFRSGEDVFLMDAAKTRFKNKEFDLVFSNGLLEHFADFTPFVKEMTRISRQYILLFQPDPTSLVGKLVMFLRRVGIISGPEEYHYDRRAYQDAFLKFNFKLICFRKFGLGGIYLLFIRS